MKLFTTFFVASQSVTISDDKRTNPINCDVADPCEDKEQCTTFIDGCGKTPVRGYLAGSVQNPPKNYRVSFDYKCPELSDEEYMNEYPNVPKKDETQWLNVLELSSIMPGALALPGDGSAFFSFYAHRDAPDIVRTIGHYPDFETPPIWCNGGEWDGFILEQQWSSWNETSVVIIRKSNDFPYSQFIVPTDDIVMPPTFYAYLSHQSDYSANKMEVKNFIFEGLDE